MNRWDDISPISNVETITCEPIKLYARQHLSPQVANDLKFQAYMDPMCERMVLDLRATMYGHKVDTQDVRVPFSRSEHFHAGTPRLLWTLGMVVALGMALTAITLTWAPAVMSIAVALVGIVVLAANPPRDETVTANGEVVVHREQFNAFPDNTMVYPNHLGRPVQFVSMQDNLRYYKR